jgi:hypothetical protein
MRTLPLYPQRTRSTVGIQRRERGNICRPNTLYKHESSTRFDTQPNIPEICRQSLLQSRRIDRVISNRRSPFPASSRTRSGGMRISGRRRFGSSSRTNGSRCSRGIGQSRLIFCRGPDGAKNYKRRRETARKLSWPRTETLHSSPTSGFSKPITAPGLPAQQSPSSASTKASSGRDLIFPPVPQPRTD